MDNYAWSGPVRAWMYMLMHTFRCEGTLTHDCLHKFAYFYDRLCSRAVRRQVFYAGVYHPGG